MIRRTCAILVLAAPASANHNLAHKVQLLTAKLNCLQKYPVFAFGDYAYYDLSDPSVEVLDTQTPTPQPAQVLLDKQEITALDFNYGTAAPPSDAYFLGVKNTSTCRAKFPTAPNPVTFARVATSARWLRLR